MKKSREIKFRAWDEEDKKMLSHDYLLDFSYQDILETWVDRCLMQFTTLMDDNKKEIYEGDLIKFNDRTIVYEVIWDPYRVAWWLKDVRADKRERDSDNDHQQLLNNSWQQRVIIGNIYENPEFLEDKK